MFFIPGFCAHVHTSVLFVHYQSVRAVGPSLIVQFQGPCFTQR